MTLTPVDLANQRFELGGQFIEQPGELPPIDMVADAEDSNPGGPRLAAGNAELVGGGLSRSGGIPAL